MEPIEKQMMQSVNLFTDKFLGEKLTADSIVVNKPDRYWVTILVAYSGVRLNEICQLDVVNIEEQDGIAIP